MKTLYIECKMGAAGDMLTAALLELVDDKDEALKVIKEQTDKLEKKVYSLLYLNKLEYLKENLNENMSYILIILEKVLINGRIMMVIYE